MPKKSKTAALSPQLLLVLLALLEQDSSVIELDELLGVPGRAYGLISDLRSRCAPGMIEGKRRDSPMRYRITDRAAATRLVELADTKELAAARQRLDAHLKSDQGGAPLAELLRRVIARGSALKTPARKHNTKRRGVSRS